MKRAANFCPNCGAAVVWRQVDGQNRPTCDACGHVIYFDPKVAAAVFIEQNDRVLLVQRANDPGQGKWTLPAGFIDAGEDPASAAIREVEEETGLSIQIDRLIDVFPRRDDGMADIVIAYAGTVRSGQLHGGDDALDARWFTRDELPELIFYTAIKLVTHWAEGKTL